MGQIKRSGKPKYDTWLILGLLAALFSGLIAQVHYTAEANACLYEVQLLQAGEVANTWSVRGPVAHGWGWASFEESETGRRVYIRGDYAIRPVTE